MATFNKNKLSVVSQPLGSGPKFWHYTDTGLLVADVSEVEGFFSTGYDCGMRKGDAILITLGDTGLAGGVTGGRQYMGTVYKSQDTGTTQTTVGLPVLVGDTS